MKSRALILFILAVAGFVSTIGLSSCSPVEEPEIPQKGFWYVLEIPAILEFESTGGSGTITPKGYVYLDGSLMSARVLNEGEVELTFVEGNEDFLARSGLSFSAGATTVAHWVYYKAVWKEYGAVSHIAVSQKKPKR